MSTGASTTARTAAPVGGWRERLRRAPGQVLRTYLVTDTVLCGDRGVVEVVRQAVAGGVSCVQVRDKHATTTARAQLARAVVAAVGQDVPVLVDDDVEAAVACGAAGAHVGQRDLDPVRARALLGEERLLGVSAGTAEQVRAAAQHRDGAGQPLVDYLGLGPVWSTPTKPDAASPLGTGGLVALVREARRVPLPVVAIGGVDADLAPSVRATGVDGLCVVRGVCAAPDPRAAAAALDAATGGPPAAAARTGAPR